MSDVGHAQYLANFRLLLLTEHPDMLIVRLTTTGGDAFDFAMPKAGSAAVFGHLALDAQAAEVGAPMPSGSGKSN